MTHPETGDPHDAVPVRPSELLGSAPSSAAFVRALGEEVRAIRERAEARWGELDPEALAWSPGEGRWSAGQCLEHLLLINAGYLGSLEGALERFAGAPRDPGLPVRDRRVGRFLAHAVGPEARRRLPAPRSLRPAKGSRPSSHGEGGAPELREWPLPAFLEQQDRILRLLSRLEGLPLDRIRIPHPATRLLRLRASTALRMLVAHEWRHLAQAERLLHHPRFPGRGAG